MQANVILSKCLFNGKSYGIRVEKRGDDWASTWAFPINENSAAREGFDKTTIEGTLQPDERFPGCPHCGVGGLMQCGCGKMMCHDETRDVGNIICPWCKDTIGKITTVDTVEVISGEM
ncbi:MAG: hypothetical protein FWG45_04425 [Oscillospiraceae bacterium]|nr:hypothetical protein [Oscillospiraceae bacterium]